NTYSPHSVSPFSCDDGLAVQVGQEIQDISPAAPRGGKGEAKRTPGETRLECGDFEPDPRGDRSPQSLARGRRDGSGRVDATRPRRVAAHRPPVLVRRACEE